MGFDSHAHSILTDFKALTSLLTDSNIYVDVDTWACRFFKTKHFRFTATTNDLKVKILASVDGGVTYPIEEVAEFTLVVATDQSKTVTTYYSNLKVQVKPAVNDAHGTLATRIAGASF